jgi:hypothetical protein
MLTIVKSHFNVSPTQCCKTIYDVVVIISVVAIKVPNITSSPFINELFIDLYYKDFIFYCLM